MTDSTRTFLGREARVSEQRHLRKNYLSLVEVLALSVAILAPTMAMAFNTAPAAAQSGTAVPLSFLVSTIAMLFVGVSFTEFSKRIAHAGAVYAYTARGLGPKTGFVSGWAITATYFCYAAGCSALFGNFADVFLRHFSIHVPIWILVGIGIAVVWVFSYQDIRLSTRAALTLEVISIVVVLILAFVIIARGGASGNTGVPFTLSGTSVSGVGMAMIFAILSFAGFEGASTLGEEAKNPRRAVPFAIFGTVLAAGIFYVFVSYAQVIGFGTAHISDLQNAASPLDTLATRYIGNVMGIFIDFAAMISAFACSLGSANACSRMLFALGRDGTLPHRLSVTHPKHSTPHVAVHTIGALMSVAYLLWGIPAGASNYYSYMGTIGTLTLLVAYLLINVAAVRFFRRDREHGYSTLKHLVIPIIGIVILLWPIYGNLVPMPAYPFNLFPPIAALWIILGIVVIQVRTRRNPAIAASIVSNLENVGG
jgi:amino acid transporter